jgi:hypothetical protein
MELDPRMSDQLDAFPLRLLVEYIARRLGLTDGHQHVRFELENGNLRRTRLGREPVGNAELECLAQST